MRAFDHGPVVANAAARPGILEQHAEASRRCLRIVRVRDDDLDAQGFGTRAHDLDGLREAIVVDEEHIALIPVHAMQQCHRFRGRRRLVEHRRVGDLHSGEVGHHRLEIAQRLEPTLRDLGLVRRVRGVPRGVLEHVAQDHQRRDGVVVTESDERRVHLVAVAERAQALQRLGLRNTLAERERVVLANRVGHRRVDQRVERLVAELGQHRRLFGGARTDVTVGERGAELIAPAIDLLPALGLGRGQQAHAHG